MKLKPLGDRLIVRAIEEEETTASGIVLPDTAKEKPQKGKVLAVGDGKVNEDTGKRTPLDVAEGDEVLYSKYGGTEIKVDGEELLVLRESDRENLALLGLLLGCRAGRCHWQWSPPPRLPARSNDRLGAGLHLFNLRWGRGLGKLGFGTLRRRVPVITDYSRCMPSIK